MASSFLAGCQDGRQRARDHSGQIIAGDVKNPGLRPGRQPERVSQSSRQVGEHHPQLQPQAGVPPGHHVAHAAWRVQAGKYACMHQQRPPVRAARGGGGSSMQQSGAAAAAPTRCCRQPRRLRHMHGLPLPCCTPWAVARAQLAAPSKAAGLLSKAAGAEPPRGLRGGFAVPPPGAAKLLLWKALSAIGEQRSTCRLG